MFGLLASQGTTYSSILSPLAVPHFFEICLSIFHKKNLGNTPDCFNAYY